MPDSTTQESGEYRQDRDPAVDSPAADTSMFLYPARTLFLTVGAVSLVMFVVGAMMLGQAVSGGLRTFMTGLAGLVLATPMSIRRFAHLELDTRQMVLQMPFHRHEIPWDEIADFTIDDTSWKLGPLKLPKYQVTIHFEEREGDEDPRSAAFWFSYGFKATELVDILRTFKRGEIPELAYMPEEETVPEPAVEPETVAEETPAEKEPKPEPDDTWSDLQAKPVRGRARVDRAHPAQARTSSQAAADAAKALKAKQRQQKQSLKAKQAELKRQQKQQRINAKKVADAQKKALQQQKAVQHRTSKKKTPVAVASAPQTKSGSSFTKILFTVLALVIGGIVVWAFSQIVQSDLKPTFDTQPIAQEIEAALAPTVKEEVVVECPGSINLRETTTFSCTATIGDNPEPSRRYVVNVSGDGARYAITEQNLGTIRSDADAGSGETQDQ